MPLRMREVRNVTILDIDGNVDINSSDIVESVGRLINSGKLHIIINLQDVNLVDYSGLSVLAISYKNVINHKGKLKFMRVPLSAIELFKIVRLDLVFDIYADEEAAVNSFSAQDVEKLKLRRKFKRLDMHLNVRYKDADNKRARHFDGNVLNISAAGVYIYTPDTLPIGTYLELEFTLPDTCEKMDASGRVIYIADRQLQPHSHPGMGVSFVRLTRGLEKAIIAFIDRNITFRSDS